MWLVQCSHVITWTLATKVNRTTISLLSNGRKSYCIDFLQGFISKEMHFRVKNPVGQENQFLRSGFFTVEVWRNFAQGFFSGRL